MSYIFLKISFPEDSFGETKIVNLNCFFFFGYIYMFFNEC